MTRTLVILLALSTSSATGQWASPAIELADVPPTLRQPNWPAGSGPKAGQGSCVNAATITILNYLGLQEHATWWRASFEGGETSTSHIRHMESSGLLYAYTDTGDADFLWWAARNRLVVGIFYKPYHAINLVDLTPQYAVLLDNNRPGVYERVPTEEFLRRWKYEHTGFAWTLVYSPPPPWPRTPH